MIRKERDGTDVFRSLKLTLSSLLQGPVIPPYLLLRTISFFHKDVCQEHLLTKDVKHTTKHPASANPPMPNQAVISGEKAFIKFQFLQGVGPNKLDWPRRDEIDEVHISCI